VIGNRSPYPARGDLREIVSGFGYIVKYEYIGCNTKKY
jgi:hypothetical protein